MSEEFCRCVVPNNRYDRGTCLPVFTTSCALILGIYFCSPFQRWGMRTAVLVLKMYKIQACFMQWICLSVNCRQRWLYCLNRKLSGTSLQRITSGAFNFAKFLVFWTGIFCLYAESENMSVNFRKTSFLNMVQINFVY